MGGVIPLIFPNDILFGLFIFSFIGDYSLEEAGFYIGGTIGLIITIGLLVI